MPWVQVSKYDHVDRSYILLHINQEDKKNLYPLPLEKIPEVFLLSEKDWFRKHIKVSQRHNNCNYLSSSMRWNWPYWTFCSYKTRQFYYDSYVFYNDETRNKTNFIKFFDEDLLTPAYVNKDIDKEIRWVSASIMSYKNFKQLVKRNIIACDFDVDELQEDTTNVQCVNQSFVYVLKPNHPNVRNYRRRNWRREMWYNVLENTIQFSISCLLLSNDGIQDMVTYNPTLYYDVF